jgi:hypothetical protein
VRHRFERHHAVTLGFLSLIKTLDPRTIADGKVGRFDKRPGQILVPVLGITLAFAFAVADLLIAHTPAVRGKVSHRRKSLYLSGLQHDRERQYLPDSRHGFKKAELRSQFNPIGNRSF